MTRAILYRLCVAAGLLAPGNSGVWANSAPQVANVTVAQRADGSRLADVGHDLAEADGGQVGDACDYCLDEDYPDQKDGDEDGVGDVCDYCELVNPDQADCQPNGIGDVCDIAYGSSRVESPRVGGEGIPGECQIKLRDLTRQNKQRQTADRI